jgi:hypothetical protein
VTPRSARLKPYGWRPSWTWRHLRIASRRPGRRSLSAPLGSSGRTRHRPTCLSWELFSRVPRLRQPSTASTPGADVAACSFGRPLPQGRRVPLSWFFTTSAVYSALEARVYCNPMPDEVRRVSRWPSSGRPNLPKEALAERRSGDRSPRRCSHPSKTPTPIDASPVSRRALIRASSVCRPFRVTAADAVLPFSRLQGFTPTEEPESHVHRCRRRETRCPSMGFVPLRDPRRSPFPWSAEAVRVGRERPGCPGSEEPGSDRVQHFAEAKSLARFRPCGVTDAHRAALLRVRVGAGRLGGISPSRAVDGCVGVATCIPNPAPVTSTRRLAAWGFGSGASVRRPRSRQDDNGQSRRTTGVDRPQISMGFSTSKIVSTTDPVPKNR